MRYCVLLHAPVADANFCWTSQSEANRDRFSINAPAVVAEQAVTDTGRRHRRHDPHQSSRHVSPPPAQGFVQFPLSGGATHLDVDTLNERLKSNGAIRHRHALRPDEAHACIFNLDDVIVDTRAVQRRAWRRLAEEEELPFPPGERQLFDIRPERVITEVGSGWAALPPVAMRMNAPRRGLNS